MFLLYSTPPENISDTDVFGCIQGKKKGIPNVKLDKLIAISLCSFRLIFAVLEATTGGVLWKKNFLEILQTSRENTCARDSFLMKVLP